MNAPELLKKFREGQCSQEELALLETWYNQYAPSSPKKLTDEEWANDVYAILSSLTISDRPEKRRVLWPRLVAAASVMLLVSIGYYFLTSKRTSPETGAQQPTRDIDPGGNKAILTLGNGEKIVLNTAKNGKLAEQGNTTINKTADGEIIYGTTKQESVNIKTQYNTVTTARGGQYHLVLADGTKVWLNAASSIKYPTVFNGQDREVEMTGEAYFEIAHDDAKPFKVITNGQTVDVLGTHFNINAYNDEPMISTTLLEGSVKVSGNGKTVLLKPQQQSGIVPGTNQISINNIDAEAAISWKEGHFHFDRSDIKTVMRQFARWYDVDVQYVGEIPEREFSGDIDRNSKASVALQILSISKVHFKIEDKKIIVTP